jgi:hypothetical protein
MELLNKLQMWQSGIELDRTEQGPINGRSEPTIGKGKWSWNQPTKTMLEMDVCKLEGRGKGAWRMVTHDLWKSRTLHFPMLQFLFRRTIAIADSGLT